MRKGDGAAWDSRKTTHEALKRIETIVHRFRRDEDLDTTRFGGTGMESSSLTHTQSYPHRLEAGTINLMGVIGLGASLDFLKRQGIEALYAHEMDLLRRLRDGLARIPEVRLYGADSLDDHVPLLSCNIQGMEPKEVSSILDGDFGICTRAGLHCAPLIHQDLGTFPKGAVRFSLGPFTTPGDIDAACEAMEKIARLGRSG